MRNYVDSKQAAKLKELGFNETTYNYYENGWLITTSHDEYYNEFAGRTAAPLLSQAQDWLREKGVYIEIIINNKGWTYSLRYSKGDNFGKSLFDDDNVNINFETYEDALSSGVSEAINFLQLMEN